MKTPEDARGEPNAAMILVVGLVGFILVFAIVVGLQAVYYQAEDDQNATKVISQAPEELSRLRSQQQEQLNTYRWIDQKTGVVGIPIDRAMEIIVRESKVKGR